MNETATKDARDTVRIAVSPAARHEMIAVAAYYRAERRGFGPGRELDDWFEASAFIDRMLAEMAAAGEPGPRRPELRNALRLWLLQGR
ncbi:MAG: DUF2934 domain-containing protein [Chromatiaceae bacterium]|jgi:hypothetical protein|nr:DUF2934 domain-containing protein [Chromatiaceae bacterium]